MKNKHLYHPDWRDIIRPAILKRDAYKCKVPGCTVRHKSKGYYDNWGSWIECDQFMLDYAKSKKFKIQTIYLQVAHLDQNPANNSVSNLRSMCPAHHLQYDRYYNNLKKGTKAKFK